MPKFFAKNSLAGLAALAVALVLLVAVVDVQAGVIDNAEEEMSYTPEEIQSYLNALEEYYEGRNEKNKRGHFCLRRDNSCPYLENGRDICCKGSQCSCNIFGQNCKCSTIGLFQRLG